MRNRNIPFKQFFIIFFAAITLSACKKADDNSSNSGSGTVNPSSGHVALIANEGNFGSGNSSLSIYSTSTKTIENQAFKNKNNQALGDVFQSICLNGNRIYMVINNSHKIVVANQSDLSYVATISGFTSPRYMVAGNNKAFVSDLYAHKIWVVDLSNNQIVDSIGLHGGTAEELAYYNNKLYSSNTVGNQLYVINTQLDIISDSITVNAEPRDLQLDNQNNLWVLSGGDTSLGETPMIQEINLQNNTITKSYSFPMGSYPDRLSYDPNNDCFYYLFGGKVYKLANGQATLSSQPVIQLGATYLYGLGVDPTNGDVYVTDPIDYIQQGWVYRYNDSYQKVDSVRAGIIPSSFAFMTH